MAASNSDSISYCMFVVDERPFCMWAGDVRDRNLTFIEALDPTYFDFLAQIHTGALETERQEHHAALALRAAYAQGVETLLAVLFATVQAPDCVIGWLHEYRSEDLWNLAQRIRGRRPILSKYRPTPVSWQGVANIVLANLQLPDADRERHVKELFATTWSRLAADYLDETAGWEYNSIKHGLRLHPGGFWLAFGLEETPGVLAPPERMRLVGQSKYGSSFFSRERIGAQGHHFRLRHHHRNWQLERYVYGLSLISLSLRNILSFLRVANGRDAAEVEFYCPRDDALFEAPWVPVPGATSFGMNEIIRPDDIAYFTDDDILAAYHADETDPGGESG